MSGLVFGGKLKLILIRLVLITFAVILVLIAFGPQFHLHPIRKTFRLPTDLPDLDGYLANEEKQAGQVVDGAEKKIFWANSQQARTPLSVVYLHGFSASRQEMQPVFEDFARSLGANLFLTRIAGHGLGPDGFRGVTAQDWIDDAEEAYEIAQKLGEKVILVGMSNGAPLAIDLAFQQKPNLKALILLAPNFYPANPAARLSSGPLGGLLTRLAVGEYREYPTANATQKKYASWKYRTEAIPQILNLVNYLATLDLSQIRVPLLVVYTKQDLVVDVKKIESKFKEFGSPHKKIIELQGAKLHELAAWNLQPELEKPLAKILFDLVDELSSDARR